MQVELPGGVIIEARGLSGPMSAERDHTPDWALYLDDGWAREKLPWPHRLIAWPDFGLPSDEPDAFDGLVEAWRRASAGARIEVGCAGGTGRTGTALACLAVQAGVLEGKAVDWVRSYYYPWAIDTAEQEALVTRFAAAISEGSYRRDRDGERIRLEQNFRRQADELERDEARGRTIEHLLSDIDRWEVELAAFRGVRSTLWYGVFTKTCASVELLVAQAAEAMMERAGQTGQELIQAVAEGKALDRLTLGQQVDLLRALDKRWRTSTPPRPIMSKAEFQVLGRVVTWRNDFVHGRLALRQDPASSERALEFLSDVRKLCNTPALRPSARE